LVKGVNNGNNNGLKVVYPLEYILIKKIFFL
jgi:hypothetical protein